MREKLNSLLEQVIKLSKQCMSITSRSRSVIFCWCGWK